LTAEHFEADGLAGAAPAPDEPDAASRPAIGVLANRLAAALVHHEPGWRLPRHTALARRYNVSPAEIETAVGELISRNLIRRLADGQLYRASPAEYLIELEGISGLSSTLDPMGGELACRSRQVSWRRVPEDIGWALGLTSADAVCVVRFLWTAGGEPAASSTT
jgi:DNA-binding GntR family transcriptional regulator